MWQSKRVALAKLKGHWSAWHWYLYKTIVLLNISRKYFGFGLNSYRKWTFQDYSHIKPLGIEFDLAIKSVKVNLDSSFVQTW